MSSHHHHHHHSRDRVDPYGSSSSSKRYHSPGDGSRMAVGSSSSGGFYDSSSKRSRSDYGSSGVSLHTSSSSSRYNDYGSSSSLLSNRYKAPSSSFYDTPGLKPSSSTSKYLSEYKGSRSTMKSSVRRIPPPLTPPSLSSSKMMKSSLSSGSSRPLPLMKVNTSSSVGGPSRDNYGGSRLRTAPPEHHSSSFGYGSSRKPDFKKPSPYVSKFATTSSYGRSSVNAFKKGTLRTAASVTSKIRRRAGVDDRRVLRVKVDPSCIIRRDNRRPIRHDKPKIKDESKEKIRESESKTDKESNKKSTEDIKIEVDLPGGEVAVVLEEVGGDSEDEENVEKKGEDGVDSEEKDMNTSENNEPDGSLETGSVDDTEKGSECVHAESTDKTENKKRRGSDGRKSDRDSSPSSRALLKLYCKYCDARHVTFREYSGHLRSFPHTKAMNTAVTDMRKNLSKLRNKQRDDQRKLEKEEKILSDTTSYCRVCELNYMSDPKEHEANELHNEIKTIIYQRCDVCEIDFRIWKVYLYHMAALEHVKRVAMKELKEAESTGDNVKGTNLSQEELGLDLVEVRTVFFCNACVRYLPIKGDYDEAKNRHCMTLTHIKAVDEFRQREKRIAERQRKRIEREEKEGKLAEKVKDEKEDSKASVEEKLEVPDGQVESKGCIEAVTSEVPKDVNETNEIEGGKVEDVVTDQSLIEIKIEETTDVVQNELEGEVKEEEGNADDVDEDEIELHAGDDVADDEESEDTNSAWNRRTRSSGRGGGSSKKNPK